MRPTPWLCALALALVVGLPSAAQPTDCSGISTAFNTDPDYIGELTTVRVASGLQYPVDVTAAPGDNDRLFVIEKPGRIRVIRNGVLLATSFLDINPIVNGGTSQNNERGLLGLAFHPDYQNNGYFYVYYTATSPSGAITISRYERMTDDLANAASGAVLLSISHPIGNHNGGWLGFSPTDGHLYVATGDGGSACDPGAFPGNAQNLNSLLGKMLRLDVDGAFPYDTDGNPFDGPTAGLDEIWSYGLRNPWRASFDRETGALYIGDVGQNAREELSCQVSGESGANYGWNAYEGFLCDTCNEWAQPCPIDLGAEYEAPYRDFTNGCSVIGGHVYRGCRMPDLHGTYFYSDYCNDFVNTLRTNANCSTTAAPDLNRENDLEPGGGISIGSIVSYGDDNQGELYIVEQTASGEIFRIVPELNLIQVSGPGASLLGYRQNGSLVWENIANTIGYDISEYRVYRSSTPDGTFTCEHSSAGASWSGGDPEDPPLNEAFFYVAVARNAAGQQTHPGVGSEGTERSLDLVSPCP